MVVELVVIAVVVTIVLLHVNPVVVVMVVLPAQLVCMHAWVVKVDVMERVCHHV